MRQGTSPIRPSAARRVVADVLVYFGPADFGLDFRHSPASESPSTMIVLWVIRLQQRPSSRLEITQ